ncbi:MAG: DUF1232 domain-containing protein [Candidatus Dadabacteria bacterium]|nr:DUF1232 domain-containing protein [Candidatus Dadabacteria bacterium]NIV41265.1 DUF1232 domain-containing protein [Candidatus Dadabacteria bacterium]NIX15108.1 DUF1232 domain-containing protein [Candidatus Dadabacteria bacterium]
MSEVKLPQKNTDEYSEEYSESSFWTKVKNYAKSAGKEVIEKSLILYFCLKDPDTPSWAKSVIAGTLGYFILPMDSIPDLTPFIGFSDDLGALAAAIGIVGIHIKKKHREMAKEKMNEWF